MRVDRSQSQPRDEWRPGVLTRMRVSAVNGAAQLCIFEQWCEPGNGAPTHLHAVEEVLHVLDGQADVWIGDAHATLDQRPTGDRAGRTQARLRQHRHGDAAHRVDARRAGVRGGLRRQARDAAPLAAGIGSGRVARRPALRHSAAVMQLSDETVMTSTRPRIRPARRDPHHPGLSQARDHVPRHHHAARQRARVPPRGRRTGAALGRHRRSTRSPASRRAASSSAARWRIRCRPASCRSARRASCRTRRVRIAYSLEYGTRRDGDA